MAIFETDPTQGGAVELACGEDEGTAYCSIADMLGQSSTGELWIVVDEWSADSYWDHLTVRTIDIEWQLPVN